MINRRQNQQEIARLVAEVQAILGEVGACNEFDAEAWVLDWIRRSIPALGGKKPADLIATREGFELVSKILAQTQSVAFA